MAHAAHYKEAHNLLAVVCHWVNFISMFLLIITGFLIHFPFIAGVMGMVRGLHIALGIVIVINWIVRIVFSFFTQSAPSGGTRNTVQDYKTWLPQKDNRHQLIPWIKYYLFIKKEHPLGAKLGVPQKICYVLIPWLIFFQAFTGFALWDVTAGAPLFAWFTGLVGGTMSLRIIHYFMMFVFILFTFIHLYLVFIEGTANAKLMLFRKEHGGLVYDPNRMVMVGEDDLGEQH